MAHLHEVRDADTHYIIDPVTMAITNANEAKNKLMLGDHDSEIYTFEIPEYVEGHDMSLCNMVEVHFINIGANKADQSVGVYPVNDLAIAEDAAGTLVFTWKVSGECTKYPGSLNYRIKFACTDESGNYTYKKWTDVYKGITISDGFDNGAATAAEYSDILSAWEARLDALEQNSGGVSSWNDLTDKPFDEVSTVILEEISPAYEEESGQFPLPQLVPLIGGEEYTVIYNGVEYTCTANGLAADGLTAVFVGNSLVMGGEDTGEPFGIASIVQYGATAVIDITGATSCTVKIVQKSVKKLDNKFLDLDWIPKKETSTETEAYLDEITLDGFINEPPKCSTTYDGATLTAGQTYQIYFGGEVYTCTAKTATLSGVESIYVGSGAYNGDGEIPVSSEPFLIFAMPSIYENRIAVCKGDKEPVTLRIDKVIKTGEVNKLPMEYLPEGYPYTEPNSVLLAETEAAEITHPTFGKMWLIEQAPGLEVGKTYTVIYNGATFSCVCQSAPAGMVDDANAVAMGNFSVVGGADTGEPFAMLISQKFNEIDTIDLSGASSVRIGIKGDVVHKMDEKYLPPVSGVVVVTMKEVTDEGILMSHTAGEIATASERNAVFLVGGPDGTYVFAGMTEDGQGATVARFRITGSDTALIDIKPNGMIGKIAG